MHLFISQFWDKSELWSMHIFFLEACDLSLQLQVITSISEREFRKWFFRNLMWVIKSEMQDKKLLSLFFSHNCKFMSHNSEKKNLNCEMLQFPCVHVLYNTVSIFSKATLFWQSIPYILHIKLIAIPYHASLYFSTKKQKQLDPNKLTRVS